MVIRELWRALEDKHNPPDPRRAEDAQETIEWLLSPGGPHTNCARSFHRTFERDPVAAYRIYQHAKAFLREHNLWPERGAGGASGPD